MMFLLVKLGGALLNATITSFQAKVIKRDGRIVKYNPDKIIDAVTKAMVAVDEVNKKLAEKVAESVTNSFNSDKEVSVEEIQNRVEDNLIKLVSTKLAKTVPFQNSFRSCRRHAFSRQFF